MLVSRAVNCHAADESMARCIISAIIPRSGLGTKLWYGNLVFTHHLVMLLFQINSVFFSLFISVLMQQAQK